jgi:sugar lactone lactonase YvrE
MDIEPPSVEPIAQPGRDGGRPIDPPRAEGPVALRDAAIDGVPERGASPDAAVMPDAGGVLATACGNQRPDVEGIANVDGIAIGRDGTIYFTRAGEPMAWVGRLRPGGAGPEPYWAQIPAGGARLWGLALDSRRSRMYVASGETGTIYRLDLTADPPEVEPLIGGLQVPNDLAVDDDGNVYVSERGDGKIHRVTPQGTRNEVTPSSVGPHNSPGGIAFGPDGALYAGTFNGPIVRLEIEGGVERSRAPWGAFTGRGNGLAFDARGRLYVGTFELGGDARLVRIDGSEAAPVEILAGPHFSGLAFGRGALDCRDLYVAIPGGPMRRLETDTRGAPASW